MFDAEPDPLEEPREYRTYEGRQWLAARRSSLGQPSPDFEAVAEAHLRHFEQG